MHLYLRRDWKLTAIWFYLFFEVFIMEGGEQIQSYRTCFLSPTPCHERLFPYSFQISVCHSFSKINSWKSKTKSKFSYVLLTVADIELLCRITRNFHVLSLHRPVHTWLLIVNHSLRSTEIWRGFQVSRDHTWGYKLWGGGRLWAGQRQQLVSLKEWFPRRKGDIYVRMSWWGRMGLVSQCSQIMSFDSWALVFW